MGGDVYAQQRISMCTQSLHTGYAHASINTVVEDAPISIQVFAQVMGWFVECSSSNLYAVVCSTATIGVVYAHGHMSVRALTPRAGSVCILSVSTILFCCYSTQIADSIVGRISVDVVDLEGVGVNPMVQSVE